MPGFGVVTGNVGGALTPGQAAKAMKGIARSLDGMVDLANERSSQIIAGRARGNLSRQPVPKKPDVIGVRSGRGAAGVELRYSRYPWAAGAEWGSKRYGQFRRWIGGTRSISQARPGGYIVSRAIADSINELDFVYTKGLTDGFKRWLSK